MTNIESPKDFRQETSARLIAEMEPTRIWYEQRLEQLGQMTVETADLTDGKNWKASFPESGQVGQVDGAFFTLTGQTITIYNKDGEKGFGWTQPGLLQKEKEILLPTREGEMKVTTSGFVGIIFDVDDNVLLTLAQEPFARTPKNAVIRTPFQTSAAKLEKLLAGERQFDPGLYDLLVKFSAESDIKEVFASGKIELFPLPYADANRIAATNTGFSLRITDAALHNELALNGQNRWFASREISYAAKAGLLNGHTANAYLAAQASL